MQLSSPVLAVLLGLGLPCLARAYESDPLTPRTDPPVDGTQLANAYADDLLEQAIDTVNAETQCQGDDLEMHAILAKEIVRTMGERTTVRSRGRQPQMWFGAYAAWLEDGPVDRTDYRDRNDLYSNVRMTNSPILHFFGPASTVQLAGVLVGTDKIDHFWIQGFDYFRVSREGTDEARAIRWGTRTELGIWGEATTGVFSYADLAANYDGYQFYAGLLGPDSILQRDLDGCVEQVADFDWNDVIDWHYDEALNPSVYKAGIASDVERWTSSVGIELCRDGIAWQHEREVLANTSDDVDSYAGDKAPPRDGAPDLRDFCPALASLVPLALADADTTVGGTGPADVQAVP